MKLFKCETIAQFKIGMWLESQGVTCDDVASAALLSADMVRVTNPAGQYLDVRWCNGEAVIDCA